MWGKWNWSLMCVYWLFPVPALCAGCCTLCDGDLFLVSVCYDSERDIVQVLFISYLLCIKSIKLCYHDNLTLLQHGLKYQVDSLCTSATALQPLPKIYIPCYNKISVTGKFNRLCLSSISNGIHLNKILILMYSDFK